MGILQIGGKLRSGQAHDGRAPDYDDWALNGDIMFWDEMLDCAMEISSMGVRVSPETLAAQLREADCLDRRDLPFHHALLNGELPWAKPHLHAAFSQGANRRSTIILLGHANPKFLQAGRHHPAIEETA